MIAVNSLRFCDNKGGFVVREEYKSLIFRDQELTERYISKRKQYWEGQLLIDLHVATDHNEIMKITEIKRVFRLVARILGIYPEAIFGRSRVRELVDARRFAMMICRGKGLTCAMIGENIGLNRTTVIHHEKTLRDLMKFNPEIRRTYEQIEDAVLSELNGQFLEDGSGKKVTNK